MLRKFLRGGSRSSPPKITGQPQSVYDAVPGSSVCLLVLTDPKQSLSEQMQFQWHHCPFAVTKTDTTARNSWSPVESGGKDRITGINSSTLLLSEVRQSDRGSYRCQITNSSGTTLSRPATITIVSPPQIEAHPRDVVDVVTGTSATFSVNVVSAAGEEVRSGGEGEEGGGGRERVGSGTREDLQIMWEVLKTNSQLPAAMNEDIVNSGENGSESPGPETPHQRIFRQHHPDLRQYLNTSSILPYLSRHSLVTSDQLEELTLPVLTNTRKVDLLLSWLPRSTVDFLEKFVICLNEANDHLAHAELAGKLQTAMAESMRRGSEVIEASFPVSPVATLSPAPSSSDSGGGETVGGGGRWEEVREKEGRVEGATTANLQLLHVDKEQEGRYRCRVEYKGCTVFSQSASLSVLEDGEIVRRLLGHCRETEEGVADAAVDRFLEEHGNSSRLAKKALVAVLDSTSDPTSLLQSFTNRQVPVNFLHNGMYPLHYACVKGHWRAVQHLITCGASKTALTQQDGRNALHLVSMRGDNNSLQFLIHTGADQLINIQDKYGKTPLHLACEAAGKIAPGKHISQDMRDIKTVIQNLLKTKSSLRAQDKNGQTPLHLAARAGHPWVVEVFLLCDIGGVDDRDNDGNTCLHIASEMNWGEVVISLLERGANETLENKEHMTPLAVAEVKGHMEVADILQRKPGTVQRNRKQTLYFTVDKGNSRPMSAHFMDGDIDMSTSPMTKSHKRLKKKSSSTDDEVRRSWSNLSASPAPDTAMKSPSSRSPSALLKWFHLTSPISQNGNELVNDNK